MVRQLEIIKWLCSKNDLFYTMDKHIQFMDKIYNVFNGTKKEFFEAKKLNEKKQKYCLHKFLFIQDLDLDGNILNARPIDDNHKDDLCYLVRHKIDPVNVSPGNCAFFDYSSICWNCGNDVFHTEQHKICPDYTCDTKYCEKCWEKIFKNYDNVKCYMCGKIAHKDFRIVDKNGKINYESGVYASKTHPLKTDKARDKWEQSFNSDTSISSDSESDSDSDSDSDESESSSFSMADCSINGKSNKIKNDKIIKIKMRTKTTNKKIQETITIIQQRKNGRKWTKASQQKIIINQENFNLGNYNAKGKSNNKNQNLSDDKIINNNNNNNKKNENNNSNRKNRNSQVNGKNQKQNQNRNDELDDNLRVRRRKKKRKERKRKKKEEKKKKKEKESKEIDGMLNSFNNNNHNGVNIDKEKEKNKNASNKSKKMKLDNESSSSMEDDDFKVNNIGSGNSRKNKDITKQINSGKRPPAPNIKPKYNFLTKIVNTNTNPLTKELLDGMKDENAKIQAIGDRLHPKIMNKIKNKDRAARVTGMLVGIQQSIILQILSNETTLNEYIGKAEQIIDKKNNNNSDSAITVEQIQAKVDQMKKN